MISPDTRALRAVPRLLHRVQVACAVLLFAGCATMTNVRTARALDPGKFQFDAALGLTRCPGCGVAVVPLPQVGIRVGVVHGLDLGLMTTGMGTDFEGTATVQLLRSRSLDLALGPALSGGATCAGEGCGTYAMAKLPFLVGINFGSQSQNQLVLGPTIMRQWYGGTDNDFGPHDTWVSGGTIAVSFPIAKQIRMMPFIGGFIPISALGVSTEQVGDVIDTPPWHGTGRQRPAYFNFGIAVSLGGNNLGLQAESTSTPTP